MTIRVSTNSGRQAGAAMIVGLIMLVLITLTVIGAFALSQGNLKAVGNIQVRNEVVAAANRAVEQAVSSLLPAGTASLTPPAAVEYQVDINNDGVNDYDVQVAAPVCVRVTVVNPPSGGSGPGGIGGGQTSSTVKTGSGNVGMGAGSSGATPSTGPWDGATAQYYSVWDISASVADKTTGAATTVRDGVRVLISQQQAVQFCGLTPP